MKKVNIILAVLVVILSVALILSFLNRKNNNDDIIIDETTTQAENITENLNIYNTAVEKKVNEELEKTNNNSEVWKKAYIDFLDNNYFPETDSEKVWLGYVDDDDVPELFISKGSYHYCTVRVYSFKNNIVSFICETGSDGIVNYFERQGIICGYYYGMGIGDYFVYKFEDGKTEKIYHAFTNKDYIPQDEEFELDININGIDISSEELDEFLDYYFNYENSISIFNDYEADYSKYELNKDTYTSYINNF